MRRVPGGSQGAGRFLLGEVPCRGWKGLIQEERPNSVGLWRGLLHAPWGWGLLCMHGVGMGETLWTARISQRLDAGYR